MYVCSTTPIYLDCISIVEHEDVNRSIDLRTVFFACPGHTVPFFNSLPVAPTLRFSSACSPEVKYKNKKCIKGESNPRRVDGNDPGYHYPINAYLNYTASRFFSFNLDSHDSHE